MWLLCKRPDLASFLPSIDLPIHILPLTTGYWLVKCLRDRLSNRSNDGQMLPYRHVLAHATTKLHTGIYHFPSIVPSNPAIRRRPKWYRVKIWRSKDSWNDFYGKRIRVLRGRPKAIKIKEPKIPDKLVELKLRVNECLIWCVVRAFTPRNDKSVFKGVVAPQHSEWLIFMNWLIDWFIHSFSHWLIHSFSHWLIDWLID